MATTTPKNFIKPTVGGSEDTWGSELNTTIDRIDSELDKYFKLTGPNTITGALTMENQSPTISLTDTNAGDTLVTAQLFYTINTLSFQFLNSAGGGLAVGYEISHSGSNVVGHKFSVGGNLAARITDTADASILSTEVITRARGDNRYLRTTGDVDTNIDMNNNDINNVHNLRFTGSHSDSSPAIIFNGSGDGMYHSTTVGTNFVENGVTVAVVPTSSVPSSDDKLLIRQDYGDNRYLEKTGPKSFSGDLTVTDRIFPNDGVRAGYGSLAAPSYSFAGDTNTGLARLDNGIVGVSHNGNLAARFDLALNTADSVVTRSLGDARYVQEGEQIFGVFAGSSGGIVSAFNASCARNNQGRYTITINAQPDANYPVFLSYNVKTGGEKRCYVYEDEERVTKTTTKFGVSVINATGAYVDPSEFSIYVPIR